MERRCLPLRLPHFFLSGAGVCWAGGGVGTPGPGCPSPLGPPDTFPAPATPGHTRHVLPHLGCRSLTFSMTPTTLQPLSCSRAELSVRMGRSLRLLKPCNGRREPRGGLRVTASSPGGRQGLSLPGDQWPQRAGPGCGQTPTSLRDRAEKLASVQGGQVTLSSQPPPSPPSRPRESSETPS